MIRKVFQILFLIVVCSGCASKFEINTRYDYEGVYDRKVDISIDGKKIDRSKDKERVWIISDRTLTYIIQEAKNSVK